MAAAITVVNVTSSLPKNVDRLPIASYNKSRWDEYFTSFSMDHQEQERNGEAIEALKEEVKSMLMMANGNAKNRMLVLVDTLERLGVAYHFEQEIEELLGQIFKFHGENTDDDDLFITSLQFRLLRQHRYRASSGVFDKFIGNDNKFKESCSDDVKGLLSLYEAAHLRIHGEPILDEAVDFTKYHLKRMLQRQLESPLQDHVKRALELPLHRNSPLIQTRLFISLYEKYDSKNEVLLKLAKLDFNYVQNLYKKDLCEISRWWSEMKLQTKFQYARDRVVESYLWGTLLHSEPRSSYARMAVAKVTQVITVVDDTYDNYATIEEADLFTDIMQRWDINEMDRLPEYMKIVYRIILSDYDDCERDAAEQEKSFAVPYAKESVKQICEAYNKELKWITGQELPSFEEYMVNSIITSCLFMLCSRTIPGLRCATEETIDWLQSEPNIIKAAGEVLRYLNDVSSYKRESKQGINMTGMDFYMKQHGASMQETVDKFNELTEDAWKDLNTEWMVRDSQATKEMKEQALGYARAADFLYRNCDDKFSRSEGLAPYVAAIFVDPIII